MGEFHFAYRNEEREPVKSGEDMIEVMYALEGIGGRIKSIYVQEDMLHIRESTVDEGGCPTAGVLNNMFVQGREFEKLLELLVDD